MARKFSVAVVGSSGAVGQEMLTLLEERDFPAGSLRAFASSRSAGSKFEAFGKAVTVEELATADVSGIDIALFSAGGLRSKEFAPRFAEAGAVVIDNSSAFRMDPQVPLVVPEVNPGAVAEYKQKRIIANPNCSTIQMLVALKPLHDRAKIKRIVVSTYQAVSGAGKRAMEELSAQAIALFNQRDIDVDVFPYQIAFNCLPQIGAFGDDGVTEEEAKLVNETRKIFADESIQVAATCVRVPVFCSHAESVNLEFAQPISPEEARELLREAEGVVLIDDVKNNAYPQPIEATGKDATFVGRVRKDVTVEHGLALWIVSDNLRKGAALNAIQIAEKSNISAKSIKIRYTRSATCSWPVSSMNDTIVSLGLSLFLTTNCGAMRSVLLTLLPPISKVPLFVST